MSEQLNERITMEMLKDIIDVERAIEMEMQGRERWPEHYQVWAIVDEYVYRKQIYQNVSMKLYREDMPEDEAIELLMTGGLSQEECDPETQTQAREIFTLEQVTALIPFIANYQGTHVRVELADKPKKNHCGFCRLPLGGGVGNYTYYKEKGYPLDFKVNGIYDVRDTESVPERKMSLDEAARHNLMPFLEVLWAQADHDADRMAELLPANGLLSEWFTMQSPEVQELMAKEA